MSGADARAAAAATKAELTAQLQAALGDLEAARELIAAIAAIAEVPTPHNSDDSNKWTSAMQHRLIAIHVHARDNGYLDRAGTHRRSVERLHELADQPLSYQPYQEEPELPPCWRGTCISYCGMCGKNADT